MTEKQAAISDLLDQPDEPCLKRGHHVTVEGHERRHEQIPELAMTYITQAQVAREDGEEHAS